MEEGRKEGREGTCREMDNETQNDYVEMRPPWRLHSFIHQDGTSERATATGLRAA